MFYLGGRKIIILIQFLENFILNKCSVSNMLIMLYIYTWYKMMYVPELCELHEKSILQTDTLSRLGDSYVKILNILTFIKYSMH